jgi:hypothetical protein
MAGRRREAQAGPAKTRKGGRRTADALRVFAGSLEDMLGDFNRGVAPRRTFASLEIYTYFASPESSENRDLAKIIVMNQ